MNLPLLQIFLNLLYIILLLKAKHPLDNFPENDSVVKQVIAYPTYNLPYSTGFEQDTSLWFAGGINSSWREGCQVGIILINLMRVINVGKLILVVIIILMNIPMLKVRASHLQAQQYP